VNLNANPVVTASATKGSICEGESTTVTAGVSSGSGDYSYSWTGTDISPTNIQTPTVTPTTVGSNVYSVTVTDNTTTCSNTIPAATSVNLNANPVVTASATDGDLCEGENTTVTANVSSGSGDYSYSWTGTGISPTNTQSPTVTPPSTGSNVYSVTVTDNTTTCSNPTPATVTVTMNANPVVTASATDADLCEGESTTVTANVSSGSGSYSYSWTGTGISPTNIQSPTVTPLSIGNNDYLVTVTDNNTNCSNTTPASTSVNVNEVPVVAASAGNQSLCEGGSTTVSANASGGSGNYSYSWTGTDISPTNIQTPTVNAVTTGSYTYSVIVTDNTTNCSNTTPATVTINVGGAPFVDAGGDKITCSTDIILSANEPGTGFTGQWSIGSMGSAVFNDGTIYNTTATGLGSGMNELVWTITGPCGSNSDIVYINQTPSSITITATANQDTLCAGSTATISAVVTSPGITPYIFSWTSSDNTVASAYSSTSNTTSIDVTPSGTGWVRYYVSVVDDNSCGNLAIDSVYSIGSQTLKIPNLITPNGDDKNDCLQILDVNGFNIIAGSVYQIYNRWGQAVYKNENYKNGDFCGGDLPDGMYYFHLETSCDHREFKGWLHILSNTGASAK
jgi:gliding motility-associated-like protein